MALKFTKSLITFYKDEIGKFISMNTENEGSYWFYFLQDKVNERGLCLDCLKPYSTKDRNTTGLKQHLLRIHSLNIDDYRQIEPKKGKSKFNLFIWFTNSTVLTSKFLTGAFTEKKIVCFLKPKASLVEVLARMTTKDDLNFRQVANSSEIHKELAARGFGKNETIPKSINAVVASVKRYANWSKVQDIKDISTVKLTQKFCVVFDEWSSVARKRYINGMLLSKNIHWNLGLIRVWFCNCW